MIISWGISGIHILIEVLRHSFKGTKTTVNISLSGGNRDLRSNVFSASIVM